MRDYYVVRTTPADKLFAANYRRTYKAIHRDEYSDVTKRWGDRLYCGPLPKHEAEAMADELTEYYKQRVPE